jgi:hypothetical protein
MRGPGECDRHAVTRNAERHERTLHRLGIARAKRDGFEPGRQRCVLAFDDDPCRWDTQHDRRNSFEVRAFVRGHFGANSLHDDLATHSEFEFTALPGDRTIDLG